MRAQVVEEARAPLLGSLLLTPVWQQRSLDIQSVSNLNGSDYSRYVILCDLPGVEALQMESLIPESRCLSLSFSESKSVAERYGEAAETCLATIRETRQQASRARVGSNRHGERRRGDCIRRPLRPPENGGTRTS